jgi:hypothetical protein
MFTARLCRPCGATLETQSTPRIIFGHGFCCAKHADFTVNSLRVISHRHTQTDTDSNHSRRALRVRRVNQMNEQIVDRSNLPSSAGSPDAAASGLMWVSVEDKNKLACFYPQATLHIKFWSDPHSLPFNPCYPCPEKPSESFESSVRNTCDPCTQSAKICVICG